MLIFGTAVNAGEKQIIMKSTEKNLTYNLNYEIINITVQEAWDILNNTSNGIQIPIDVRYEHEWISGFIDTPYPECPIWYVKDLFQENATWLQWFLDEYAGEELIIYCKGGYRSLIVSYILGEAGFGGTVYNMLGGITAWQSAGFPIRNNTQPNAPNIDGPPNGKTKTIYTYNFTTQDAEGDGIYYWIDWGDNTSTGWLGPFGPNEQLALPHAWKKQGTYLIKAKAKDFYGNESDWTELEINMPRNIIAINKPFLNFLQSHPNIFPILQRLLQRLGL